MVIVMPRRWNACLLSTVILLGSCTVAIPEYDFTVHDPIDAGSAGSASEGGPFDAPSGQDADALGEGDWVDVVDTESSDAHDAAIDASTDTMPEDGAGDGTLTDDMDDDSTFKDGSAPGSVVEWLMDEGNGQAVNDTSGNNYLLMLGKTPGADPTDPKWVTDPGRVCRTAALEFDGVDDVATAGGIALLDQASSFSATFCVYATAAGGGSLGRVLSKEVAVSDDLGILVTADSMKLAFHNTAGDEFITESAHGALSLSTRNCWAVTYDDTSVDDRAPHIYKDGVEVAYTARPAVTGTYKTTANPWTVGNRKIGGRAFAGVIDSVRIDDHVLLASVISERAHECGP
jgi:hypothetical protein